MTCAGGRDMRDCDRVVIGPVTRPGRPEARFPVLPVSGGQPRRGATMPDQERLSYAPSGAGRPPSSPAGGAGSACPPTTWWPTVATPAPTSAGTASTSGAAPSGGQLARPGQATPA